MDTRTKIIGAARTALLADGFANLSTRKVAEAAGVPLSQIHYHFGGKGGLVLALLEYENRGLVERQQELYASAAPLSVRYDRACDFLDDDLASGYVRVLQEMVAAGWSDSEVATQVVALVRQWLEILERVAQQAEEQFGRLGPFSAAEVAQLVGLAFLGGETLLLLGDADFSARTRGALRRVGELIRLAEAAAATGG
jgi:AcrR family transcriptional regulator